MGFTEFPRRLRLAEGHCSHCDRALVLSAEEQVTGRLHCPYCHAEGPPRLPWEVRCPGCARELRLSAAERTAGQFTCDRCHGVTEVATADATSAMALAAPATAEEIARLKAVAARAAERDVKVGVAWLIGGVVLSGVTIVLSGGDGVYFTGAVIYGVYRIVRGASHKA